MNRPRCWSIAVTGFCEGQLFSALLVQTSRRLQEVSARETESSSANCPRCNLARRLRHRTPHPTWLPTTSRHIRETSSHVVVCDSLSIFHSDGVPGCSGRWRGSHCRYACRSLSPGQDSGGCRCHVLRGHVAATDRVRYHGQ